MRLNRPPAAAALLCVFLALQTLPTRAAEPPASPATDAAELSNFQLDQAFLRKWEALMDDPSAPRCNMMGLNLHNGTISGMTSRFAARPGVTATLARHGLTAHELVLGMSTLSAAYLADLRASHPRLLGSQGGAQIGDANMAFYHRHKGEIAPYVAKAAKRQRSRDDKLPSCLK